MISKRDRSTNLKNNAGAGGASGVAGVAGNVMQCEPKGGFLIFLFFSSSTEYCMLIVDAYPKQKFMCFFHIKICQKTKTREGHFLGLE